MPQNKTAKDRLEQKAAELRSRAKMAGHHVRSGDDIRATADWSIPETTEVQSWIDDVSVGREKATPMSDQTAVDARAELAEYLLSADYRHLLWRAILSRLSTTSNHHDQHLQAVELFEAAYPEICK